MVLYMNVNFKSYLILFVSASNGRLDELSTEERLLPLPMIPPPAAWMSLPHFRGC